MAKLIDNFPQSNSVPFADMRPGEVRAWVRPSNGEAITITRTNRPFICDWVDAANDRLAQSGKTYLRWVVSSNGEAALVTK
jgi:hypothetical protein